MEINLSEGGTDPKPSPSPGPSPTPPPSKPEHWQVPPLPLPPQASKALADYVVAAKKILQQLADTMGSPEYAVPAPTAPPAAPLLSPSGEVTGLAGFAAESYSTSSDVLHAHSGMWLGADNTAVTVAQRAAAVGSTALKRLQHLIYRLRDVFHAVNLAPTLLVSYTELPSAGDGLASYAEYELALAVEQTLNRAYDVVLRAQKELGIDGLQPMMPLLPVVPRGMLPPKSVPMPNRQRHPQPGTLEI